EKIEYYPGESSIRVNGRNVYENEHVHKYGTTIIWIRFVFLILFKQKGEACDPSYSADVAAILIQEGLAHIFLINKCSTTLKNKIKHNIPRKHKGHIESREKANIAFYSIIINSMLNNLNFEILKCVIFAGPGFYKVIKDDLLKYIHSLSDDKYLIFKTNKFKFIALSDTKVFFLNDLINLAILESKSLTEFYSMINSDPSRAFYGILHVEIAAKQGAIETLLISDHLLRKRYLKIFNNVKKNSGVTRVFSEFHETGKELNQYSGIAAILRYPMDGLNSIPLEDILNDIGSLGF
ncbi:hypothetical protein MXB_4705, partial [Myxobolus squamalis]